MKHTARVLAAAVATLGSIAHADAHDARVRAYILDSRGGVDGLLLSDQGTVRFPTATGDTVARHVRVGERVQVSRDGMTLLAPRTGWSADVGLGALGIGGGPSFAPPIAAHEHVGASDGMTISGNAERGTQRFTVQGRVAGLSYTRGHMVDGVLLDGGITVRVPPSQAAGLSVLRPGETVRVVGSGMRGAHGIGMRAEQISTAGRQSVYSAE